MPGPRGPGADEQRSVAVAEGNFGVIGSDDLVEGRECAVGELHDDALQRRQSGRDFQEVQIDRLIRAEHRSGGDAEGEGIADLAGGAGDRDVQGWLHDSALFSNERARDFTAMAGEVPLAISGDPAAAEGAPISRGKRH